MSDLTKIRIIFKDAYGNLNVVWIMNEFIERRRKENLDDEAIKQQIIEKDILPYCPSGIYHEIDFNDLPDDRYFRNAWDHDENGKHTYDRAKAENIHMNNLRAMRTEKLTKLDVEYMKALENGDNAKSKDIATKKQQLRDMPQTEDLSKFTIEELKDYIPEYLKD